MSKEKVKKIMLSVASVALVAVMVIMGTVAYLQGESDEAVNTFTTNEVKVELTEDSGEKYDIIPGTTDTKNPKVKATVTLPSYVFVEVTDIVNGQGKKLVEYEIDDGWKPLLGHDNVWYREIAESDKEGVSVLKGDTVIYPSNLTNEDMKLLENGDTLSFKAYAIQKQPFKSAEEAYQAVPITVNSESELQDALDHAIEGKTIQLTSDVNIEKTLIASKNAILDLNGKTISLKEDAPDIWNQETDDWSLISVRDGAQLTINGDGNVIARENDTYAVDIQGGAKVIINGGTYNGNIHAVYVYQGELKVNGGTFMIQQLYPQDDKQYQFVLNCKDDQYKNGNAKITVNGGTYQNFNPSNNGAEGEETNFMASGHEVTEKQEGEITWYTVSQIVQNATADNLESIISEAEVGSAVKLTGKVVMESGKNLTISKDLTIIGDDSTIIEKGSINVAADVTFENITFVKPENQSNNASMVYVKKGAEEIVFDGCTFTDPQWEAIQITSNDIKNIVVTNCTFGAADVKGATSSYGNTADQAIRFIHVECNINPHPEITMTITNNTFCNIDKVKDSIIGVYYVTGTITVGGNTFEGWADGDKTEEGKAGKLSVGWPENDELKYVNNWEGENKTFEINK